jgi:hypothetical protein
VGSYLGRSTIALAAHTPGTVWALDDWYGPRDDDTREEDRPELYQRFLANIAGLPVIPIRADHADLSLVPPEWLTDYASKPDMVFIDGAHDYESVKRDITNWKARLAPGGLLCGHDRNQNGVLRALREMLPRWSLVEGNVMLWRWKKTRGRG